MVEPLSSMDYCADTLRPTAKFLIESYRTSILKICPPNSLDYRVSNELQPEISFIRLKLNDLIDRNATNLLPFYPWMERN